MSYLFSSFDACTRFAIEKTRDHACDKHHSIKVHHFGFKNIGCLSVVWSSQTVWQSFLLFLALVCSRPCLLEALSFGMSCWADLENGKICDPWKRSLTTADCQTFVSPKMAKQSGCPAFFSCHNVRISIRSLRRQIWYEWSNQMWWSCITSSTGRVSCFTSSTGRKYPHCSGYVDQTQATSCLWMKALMKLYVSPLMCCVSHHPVEESVGSAGLSEIIRCPSVDLCDKLLQKLDALSQHIDRISSMLYASASSGQSMIQVFCSVEKFGCRYCCFGGWYGIVCSWDLQRSNLRSLYCVLNLSLSHLNLGRGPWKACQCVYSGCLPTGSKCMANGMCNLECTWWIQYCFLCLQRHHMQCIWSYENHTKVLWKGCMLAPVAVLPCRLSCRTEPVAKNSCLNRSGPCSQYGRHVPPFRLFIPQEGPTCVHSPAWQISTVWVCWILDLSNLLTHLIWKLSYFQALVGAREHNRTLSRPLLSDLLGQESVCPCSLCTFVYREEITAVCNSSIRCMYTSCKLFILNMFWGLPHQMAWFIVQAQGVSISAETRALWEELFTDITQFDDVRAVKALKGSNAPDFSHKASKKGLWWVQLKNALQQLGDILQRQRVWPSEHEGLQNSNIKHLELSWWVSSCRSHHWQLLWSLSFMTDQWSVIMLMPWLQIKHKPVWQCCSPYWNITHACGASHQSETLSPSCLLSCCLRFETKEDRAQLSQEQCLQHQGIQINSQCCADTLKRIWAMFQALHRLQYLLPALWSWYLWCLLRSCVWKSVSAVTRPSYLKVRTYHTQETFFRASHSQSFEFWSFSFCDSSHLSQHIMPFRCLSSHGLYFDWPDSVWFTSGLANISISVNCRLTGKYPPPTDILERAESLPSPSPYQVHYLKAVGKYMNGSHAHIYIWELNSHL